MFHGMFHAKYVGKLTDFPAVFVGLVIDKQYCNILIFKVIQLISSYLSNSR